MRRVRILQTWSAMRHTVASRFSAGRSMPQDALTGKRRGRLVIGALLATTVALLGVSGVSAARVDRFTGTIAFEPSGSDAAVDLRVRVRGGDNKFAIFKVENLMLACENDTTRIVDLPPEKVKFRRASVFRTEIYSVESDGTEIFYEIRGRLLSRNRARGTFTYRHDPVNPPGSDAPPDCSSARGEIWRATRSD